jgi:hypothetical protein
MAREYRTLKTEVRLPYEVAYGATWTRFFEGLKDKKIYGTRCKECKRVLVPARSFCPRCFVTTDEWVEVKEEGTLVAWCYTKLPVFRDANRASLCDRAHKARWHRCQLPPFDRRIRPEQL